MDDRLRDLERRAKFDPEARAALRAVRARVKARRPPRRPLRPSQPSHKTQEILVAVGRLSLGQFIEVRGITLSAAKKIRQRYITDPTIVVRETRDGHIVFVRLRK